MTGWCSCTRPASRTASRITISVGVAVVVPSADRSPRGAVGIMQLMPETAANPVVGIDDIDVDADRTRDLAKSGKTRPDGRELPQGHGTAKEGAQLYVQKGCAGCHGRAGSGANAPTLIKSDGTMKNMPPCLAPCVNDSNVMALHSPYATVMWDYINRGMPLGKEGSLQPDEVGSIQRRSC